MDKSGKNGNSVKKGISFLLARSRCGIQFLATLLTNIHLPNFFKGKIYQGSGKTVCVPGLNCYSCLGRFICGFLCPFGWFQDLLHKIPGKKFSTKKLRPLRYIKYAVLLIMVLILPAVITNSAGMGNPFFCKYLCPQGVLEGAIPLALADSGIRSALGSLFAWKSVVLITVIILSILFYRPFCKWICPLGAFYSLFNRVSLFQMQVDESKCISCGKCQKACKMDVDVTQSPNHPECIRCGACIHACPTQAVCYHYGFATNKTKQEYEIKGDIKK